MSKRNTRKRKGFETAVVVAVIGLIGTVFAAYMQFASTKAEVEIPIKVTQTSAALLSKQPTATFIPTNTSFPPTLTLTASPTPDYVSWKRYLGIDLLWNQCYAKIPPVSVSFVSDDPVSSYQEFQNVYGDWPDDWFEWDGIGPNFSLRVEIWASGENAQWVIVDSRINFDVIVDTPPEHIDAIRPDSGCGGGMVFRYFPDVQLLNSTPKLEKYSLSVKYPDFDAFSLQPGEAETFIFSFVCKAPGVYSVNAKIPYKYANKEGVVSVAGPKLVCPQRYTMWVVGDGFAKYEHEYVWDGTQYVVANGTQTPVSVSAEANGTEQTVVEFTPTPWTPCQGAYETHLFEGGFAYVGFYPPLANNVRTGPGKEYGIVGKIQPGELVQILNGPECADN